MYHRCQLSRFTCHTHWCRYQGQNLACTVYLRLSTRSMRCRVVPLCPCVRRMTFTMYFDVGHKVGQALSVKLSTIYQLLRCIMIARCVCPGFYFGCFFRLLRPESESGLSVCRVAFGCLPNLRLLGLRLWLWLLRHPPRWWRRGTVNLLARRFHMHACMHFSVLERKGRPRAMLLF